MGSKAKWSANQRALLSLCVIAMMALSGCIGLLGIKTLPDPSGSTTRISGQVIGTEFDHSSTMTIQAMAGGSAIPFATVQAYTFPQMQPIGAAVQTDANGKYTITGLPLDQAYIIIATKQIDGKSIRLSTYVEVYGEETTADIDVTSSLVVEYVRTMVDTDPTFVVDQFDFDAIREAVEANMELDNISMFVGEGTFLLDGGISEDVMDLSRPHFFAFDGCMA